MKSKSRKRAPSKSLVELQNGLPSAYSLVIWLGGLHPRKVDRAHSGEKSAAPVLQNKKSSAPRKRGRKPREILLDCQAARIISRFGGVDRLVRAMKHAGYHKDRSRVYRWMYPYPKGTGGNIPYDAYLAIKCAARVANVKLTVGDFTRSDIQVEKGLVS